MRIKIRNTLPFLLLFTLSALDAYSRAGGAGGGGGGGFGGGGFGGGGGGTSLSPTEEFVVFLIVIVLVIYNYNKKKKGGNNDMTSDTSGGPQGVPPEISPAFFAANEGFSEQVFIQKFDTAFMAIQEAWMKKDLSKVRRWISDGVYQRFNGQFIMMNLLQQTNPLSNIHIRQMRIEATEQEGAYSIITASVYFSMDDNFICQSHPEFNESFTGDTATEYWTFIKKSGVEEKDLYHNNNCPNCGYPLKEDAGEVSKCESCGTITYLGDYDWVLCEITQEDDYMRGNYRISKDDASLQPLYADPDNNFSIQMMEDKASNAIMQYFVSHATHDLKYVHRFTDETLFKSIEQAIKAEAKFVFNRLYLNEVSMISCTQANNMWLVSFEIFYSSMRLQATAGGLRKTDNTVVERALVLTLGKKVGVGQKSKLWSFECPSCGAPYTDTTVTQCSYCGAQINSSDNDWVMIDLKKPN